MPEIYRVKVHHLSWSNFFINFLQMELQEVLIETFPQSICMHVLIHLLDMCPWNNKPIDILIFEHFWLWQDPAFSFTFWLTLETVWQWGMGMGIILVDKLFIDSAEFCWGLMTSCGMVFCFSRLSAINADTCFHWWLIDHTVYIRWDIVCFGIQYLNCSAYSQIIHRHWPIITGFFPSFIIWWLGIKVINLLSNILCKLIVSQWESVINLGVTSIMYSYRDDRLYMQVYRNDLCRILVLFMYNHALTLNIYRYYKFRYTFTNISNFI